MAASWNHCMKRRKHLFLINWVTAVLGTFTYIISWNTHSELWNIFLPHFTDKGAEAQGYF